MADRQALEERIRILEEELRQAQARHVVSDYGDVLSSSSFDLNDQKRKQWCEEQAANERANDMRRSFMEKSGHDVRTALNSVFSALDVLEESSPSPLQEYVGMAMEEAMRLHNTISNTFDFFKLETAEIELQSIDFDLKRSLDSDFHALSFDADSREIEFSCDIASDVPQLLRGDGRRLSQVLAGIIGNRLRYTADEGAVALNVSKDGYAKDGGIVLRFTITDTSRPMPDAVVNGVRQFVQQDIVPGRFQPLVAGEANLDLVCALRLLKIFKADIGLSASDNGNIICFSLPFQIPGRLGSVAPKLVNNSCSVLCGKRVLVVEDDLVNRVLVTKMLEQHGIEVVSAEDGRVGIEKVAAEDFDLVLMDVQMPVIDGLEATRIVRASERGTGKRTKIIALTALIDREKCLQVGIDDYLSKPLDKKVFLDTLTEHLTPSALIVHESIELVQTLMGNLFRRGWRVITAETSRQALYEAALGRFDLFCIDTRLSSVNGVRVTEVVRQLDQHVGRTSKIIGLGAFAEEDKDFFDTVIVTPCTPLEVDEQLALFFEGA